MDAQTPEEIAAAEKAAADQAIAEQKATAEKAAAEAKVAADKAAADKKAADAKAAAEKKAADAKAAADKKAAETRAAAEKKAADEQAKRDADRPRTIVFDRSHPSYAYNAGNTAVLAKEHTDLLVNGGFAHFADSETAVAPTDETR
ncbi:hypothetical protein KB206_10735 [Microvirga sp. STS02]|uniref:hypothetical protein n=1 Tax=Hymenobacter negativus TaxID=2795026 RepID=UPI0018DD2573|nr:MULTISPECIES: hypothetical protein [Bacteria]MBH8569362.1 hypothetical protein [Hymenobacter negativus]MBR7209096.1 hypothetical protein [Microvirga sp. STS02]